MSNSGVNYHVFQTRLDKGWDLTVLLDSSISLKAVPRLDEVCSLLLQFDLKISNVFQIFSPAFSDQCRSDDAMILFSIFDHDVLTANDFGGEAFFALKNVPGVQCGNSSVGNFRGLKQVDLPLMFQENKGEEPNINSRFSIRYCSSMLYVWSQYDGVNIEQ